MLASKLQTPVDRSDKLSRPFKADVREHIQTAITDKEFRLFIDRKGSDLAQPKFKLEVDPTSLKSCFLYVSDILSANKESGMYTPLAKLFTEISRVVHRMKEPCSCSPKLVPPPFPSLYVSSFRVVEHKYWSDVRVRCNSDSVCLCAVTSKVSDHCEALQVTIDIKFLQK